jgi:photosystem II stability/assembly factor-like uncharacterized protein
MVSLVVHPQIPDLLWLGSDVSGPWKREPGQDRWQAQGWNCWRPQNTSGVGGLAIDPRNGSTVYVERGDPRADLSKGLYVTRDGGKSWRLVLNKYSLSNAGPARKWGPSIAVDPNQPEVVYWGTFRDGGQTWDWISNDDHQMSVSEPLPWNQKMPVPASGSGLVFDPHHPGRVYMLDAFMVYQTEDIWAKKPDFRALWKGVENTVVLTLCTPPASQDGLAPVLLSGLADIRGFRHADIHQPPSRYVEPTVSKEDDWATNVTGYDYCEGNPAVMMCAKHDDRMRPGKVLLSSDGGKSWQQVTDPLGKIYGGTKIAVSARWNGSTDTLKAVFAPGNGQVPRTTRDGGTTWAVCRAADGSDLKTFSYISHAFNFSQYVAADRVDGDTFYLYRFSGDFWVSRDGGATWKEKDFKKVNPPLWDSRSPPTIQAAPGRAGEIWAAMSGFGIRRSRDFGETWETLPGIVQIQKFAELNSPASGSPCLVAFGAAAPGKPANEPTVFLFARLPGEETHSLFRTSDIAAATLSDMKWQRVQKWEFGGILPNMMQGSRQNFGQIFMSGAEHGIICGEPQR